MIIPRRENFLPDVCPSKGNPPDHQKDNQISVFCSKQEKMIFSRGRIPCPTSGYQKATFQTTRKMIKHQSSEGSATYLKIKALILI
jgi:hypothetical protein